MRHKGKSFPHIQPKEILDIDDYVDFWLDTHGGKNRSDLNVDGSRLYVWMGNGNYDSVKVYIPQTDIYKDFSKIALPVDSMLVSGGNSVDNELINNHSDVDIPPSDI